MSNSTTLLDTVPTSSANKEATVNALMDAASPATLWGRRASTSSGLTWGYYGGTFNYQGTLNAIANGTLTLTASATNYVYAAATTGAVSFNTTGFPAGSVALYTVVTGASSVTSYTDQRSYQPSATGGAAYIPAEQLMGGGIKTAAYTMATGDRGNVLVMNSSSAVSQPLPAATGSSGNFPNGWYGYTENIGSGTETLTVPSGANLDGVLNGTVAIPANQGLGFFTDGTNWFTIRGLGGSGGMTNPMTTLGDIITGASGGTPQRLGVGTAGQVLTVVSGAPAWAAAGSGTAYLNMLAYSAGTPGGSAKLLQAIAPQAKTLPINLTGSYAYCDVAPTASVACTINKISGGSTTAIGSVNFAASATTGTFTFSSAVSLAAGDMVQVVAPATPDATFAGPTLALVAS